MPTIYYESLLWFIISEFFTFMWLDYYVDHFLTSINFGQKMSDVKPLFQVLHFYVQSVFLVCTYLYACTTIVASAINY